MRGASSFMHPLVSEVARFVLAGSSSGGFGLACPAHCSSSITLLSDVFLSGFGCGALIVLLWIYWAFFSSHPPSLSLPGLDLPICTWPPSGLLAWTWVDWPESLVWPFHCGYIADSLESAVDSRKRLRQVTFFPSLRFCGCSLCCCSFWGLRHLCHFWLCACFPKFWGGWTYHSSSSCCFGIVWRIGRGRCRPGTTSLGSWTLRAVPEGRIQKPRPTPNRQPTWFCVALAFIAVLWSTPRLSSSASGQGSPRTACPTVSRQNLRPVSAALPRHLIFLSNDRPELGLHQDCREHRSWPSLCPPEPCGRVGGPWYEDALALPVLTGFFRVQRGSLGIMDF